MNEPALIREMLGQPPARPGVLAVVGLSDRVGRPSHYVSKYGYKILPVNPAFDEAVGTAGHYEPAGGRAGGGGRDRRSDGSMHHGRTQAAFGVMVGSADDAVNA